jgi:peroxiredoxin
MAEMKDRFEHAAVLVISFEKRERVAWLQDRLQLPFLVALDPHRIAYRTFELGRASFMRTYTRPEVVLFYGKALLRRRVPDIHLGQDRRQLGGDFVLDREGSVVLAHPERGPEDRAPVGEILRAIENAPR